MERLRGSGQARSHLRGVCQVGASRQRAKQGERRAPPSRGEKPSIKTLELPRKRGAGSCAGRAPPSYCASLHLRPLSAAGEEAAPASRPAPSPPAPPSSPPFLQALPYPTLPRASRCRRRAKAPAGLGCAALCGFQPSAILGAAVAGL